MIHWDTNISLGTIIEIASFVVVLYGFHLANVKRIVKMETAFEKLEKIEGALDAMPAMRTKIDAIWEWFLTRNNH